MNKEEYADKFMSRAKQDIKICENEDELQIYIAALLENIDYWRNEYDYMKKYRNTLQQENNHLQQQLDQALKDYEEQLKINEEHQKLNGELQVRIDNQEFLLISQGKELKELYSVVDKAIEIEEKIMYLVNKVAITTQNIEAKAVRDRLEEIFKRLKGE